MKKNLLISTSGFLSAFIAYQTALAQTVPTGIVSPLATIQQQDIDSVKRLEQEKRGQRDYQNRRLQDIKKEKKPTKKRRKATEPAKPSEYKTKGVYIEKIEVPQSEILTKEEIADIIEDYEQTNLMMEDIKELVARLNELYLNKGFITARAYLPEQTIENGLLKVAIIEGKVGDVNIKGNLWTKKSHIKNRLAIDEGEIFNIQKLENNLVIYNRYNDGIMLTGDLNPGKKSGTTDITVKAEEKAPYHLIAVADNAGRRTIGKNRGGIIAQHDSLFGYRDKLSAGIYANRYSQTPFIDYNIPVNKKDGRIGISFSHNKSEIGRGAYKDFNIENSSDNYSIYYSHPLIRELHKELNSTTSYTYKRAVNRIDGYNMYKDKIPELKTGLNFRYDTLNGVWYLAQNISYAAPWYQDNIDYWKFEGNIARLHDCGHRFTGYFRGNYQYIPQHKIPFADQMSAGGFGTVRGYSQGLLTAKSGYQLGAEIYFPLGPEEIKINQNPYRIDEYVRPFVFTDYAALYPDKKAGAEGFNNSDILLSAGAGLRFQLPYDMALKVAYGVPLRHNKYEHESGGDWSLELTFSPDFNRFFEK